MLTRKQVDMHNGKPVVLVTVYGDQFYAVFAGNDGRWSFRTQDGGLYARDDIAEWHLL